MMRNFFIGAGAAAFMVAFVVGEVWALTAATERFGFKATVIGALVAVVLVAGILSAILGSRRRSQSTI